MTPDGSGGSADPALVRGAIAACAWSVAWAALVGVPAVIAGATHRSVALFAFGLDSMVDGSASAVLVWRFTLQLRGAERADRAERIARRMVGVAMLLAATYVSVQAIRTLVDGSAPKSTAVGLILLAASALVLPVLGSIKLRLARELHSEALRGDGVLSSAGGALALVAMAGLLLGRTSGWSWADPVGALLIASVLVREAWRALSR